MSFKNLLVASIAIIVLSTVSLAQQPAPNAPATDRMNLPSQEQTGRTARTNRRPRVGKMRAFAKRERLAARRALNLTDEQRTQQRAIRQKHLAATRSQRDQLFLLREKRLAGTFTAEDKARLRSLRQETLNLKAGARNEASSILTTEQKAQMESRREQRQQRRQEMLKRRKEVRPNPPGN
jgi:Spy/CpxP family protein refolding chaperone